MRRNVVVLTVVLFGLVACEGRQGPPGPEGATAGGPGTACESGRSIPCGCESGATGAQTCAEDGSRWSPCVCGREDDSPDDGCVELECPDGQLCDPATESCRVLCDFPGYRCPDGEVCAPERGGCVPEEVGEGEGEGEDECEPEEHRACPCADGSHRVQLCVEGEWIQCPCGAEGEGECEPGWEQPCPDGTNTGECIAGVRVCSEEGEWGPCDGQIGPAAEVCDAVDNDCDGVTDEGWGVGDRCEVGVGECRRSGTMECRAPGVSTCDVERGAPAPEACDGRDNDCDGQTDEDYEALGTPCEVGIGACRRTGIFGCGQDGLLECGAVPGEAGDEQCDGRDNDCDGQTDEALTGELADLQGGVCAGARRICGGADGWTEPDYAGLVERYEPAERSCDRLDNDCDGLTDEPFDFGLRCDAVGECWAAAVECNAAGDGTECRQQGSIAEICNGLDDDCDGEVDEDFEPPAGFTCTRG